MMKSHWISYEDLAWTEPVISPPGSYREVSDAYWKYLCEHSEGEPVSLLHLGSGAGLDDFNLKSRVSITGVDISRGMVDQAKKFNPEVEYHIGDMREVRLERTFDAVMIPDSAGYMVSEDDLVRAVSAAEIHLKPGGVLLIVCHTREEFRNNNFTYSGSLDDTEITVFENNHICGNTGERYEAVMVYLIRKQGHLEIITDIHTLGLHSRSLWMDLFRSFSFDVKEHRLDSLYDPFLLEEGSYPLTVFTCRKPEL